MNTIIENKPEATSEEPKSYTDIRDEWKALAASRKITAPDIAALCIYRAMIHGQGKDGAIAQLKKSFTPVTNPIKLSNGVLPNNGLYYALATLTISFRQGYGPIFLNWITKDEKQELAEIAASIDAYYKEIK